MEKYRDVRVTRQYGTLLMAVILAIACASGQAPIPQTPFECIGPALVLAQCLSANARPTATATATATATVRPVATVVITPTATATPAIRFLPTVASACDKKATSQYAARVRGAMDRYRLEHPEQFDGSFFQYPLSQDVFLTGISGLLSEYGLDGMIDPCMCGDLVVAAHDTPLGSGFAEQFHPISSVRVVQSQPYLERCTPRWLAPVPVSPTEVGPMPELLTIDVAKLAGGKFVGPSGTCQTLNFTPRFDVGGRTNVPCNAEHPNCGDGNNYEPDPAQVRILVVSQAFPTGLPATDDYLSRACGQDGSAFSAVATLLPGATDRRGRALNLSKFHASPISGVI